MRIHFDRQVESTIVAQVLLAYNSMFRAATDRQEFNRAVSMFDEALDETTSQNLLAAYIILQQTSSNFQSKAKAQKRTRKAKEKAQPQSVDLSDGGPDPADLQTDPQLCLDLADLQTGAKGSAPVFSAETSSAQRQDFGR